MRAEKQFLAVFYAVRALLHQDRNDIELSNQDRLRVQQLGHSAEALMDELPDDWQLLYFLQNGSQLLDTRAMVNFKLSRLRWQSALNDLDIAVLASDLLNLSLSDSIQNTVRDESGDFYQAADIPRQLAAILKHRSELYQKMGEAEQAETDLDRIEELGFERNEALF